MSGCGGAGRGSCGGEAERRPENLEQVVRCYLRYDAPRSREELEYFGDRRLSLEQVISRAGRSAFGDGTIHTHQQRIGHARCAAIAQELLHHIDAIRSCRDFETLRSRVVTAVAPIFQHADLTVYDVAQRIGHFLGIEPELVYLHRGVRDGALALLPRLPAGQRTLRVTDLPSQFHQLTPAQCEDLLCIYKDDLPRIIDRLPRGQVPKSFGSAPQIPLSSA